MSHFTERTVDWRTVDLAVRHCRGMRFVEEPPLERNEISAIVALARAPEPDLPYMQIRDWLASNVSTYVMEGIYRIHAQDRQGIYGYPIALRFTFKDDDDKFLFSLRWS